MENDAADSLEHVLKVYVKFFFVWTPCIVLLLSLTLYDFDDFFVTFIISLTIAEVCMTLSYFGARGSLLLQQAYFRKRGWPLPKRSVPIEVLLSLVFIYPGLQFGNLAVAAYAPLLGIEWRDFNLADYRRGMIYASFSIAVYLAVMFRRKHREQSEMAEKQRVQLETQTLKAQISALTAQMNPHLLFNSLNSIASLIPSDALKAEDMTVELSKFLRAVLNASKREKHSLEEEFELCRSYLLVEQGRFGDRVKFDFVNSDGLDLSSVDVPVLCVQPFIENSLKHALLPRVEGGSLQVSVACATGCVVIAVEDDGPGFGAGPKQHGTGTAMENCRNRLRLFYGDSASLQILSAEPQGTRIELRIPTDVEPGRRP